MKEFVLGKKFCRFAFWLNVIGVVLFFVDVLILKRHLRDMDYVFAFANTMFAWKFFWPRCEYDTTWYRRLISRVKWTIHKWKNKK